MKVTTSNKEITKQIEQLESILDPEYFHMCISIGEKNAIEWSVYYKNLPRDLYYSNDNTALLTSEKNTIEDIKKLNENFKKEKQKASEIEINKNIVDFINFVSVVDHATWKMKDNMLSYDLFILASILVLLTVNMVLINSKILSITLLTYTTINILVKTYIDDKFSKKRLELTEKLKKVWIKDKIKQLGFDFVEKIKARKD